MNFTPRMGERVFSTTEACTSPHPDLCVWLGHQEQAELRNRASVWDGRGLKQLMTPGILSRYYLFPQGALVQISKKGKGRIRSFFHSWIGGGGDAYEYKWCKYYWVQLVLFAKRLTRFFMKMLIMPTRNDSILYLNFILFCLSWLVPEIICCGSVFLTSEKAIQGESFLLYFYFYFNEIKWKSYLKIRKERRGLGK